MCSFYLEPECLGLKALREDSRAHIAIRMPQGNSCQVLTDGKSTSQSQLSYLYLSFSTRHFCQNQASAPSFCLDAGSLPRMVLEDESPSPTQGQLVQQPAAVQGYWPDDDSWLDATVLEAYEDGSWLIMWAEDSSESVLPADYVRIAREVLLVNAAEEDEAGEISDFSDSDVDLPDDSESNWYNSDARCQAVACFWSV